jgi:GNAT superfamily N-acetyltransferase
MPSLQIRPVSAADYVLWLPLWQGYQRFYQTEISPAISAVTWQRLLDPAEPMFAALAWQDQQAVGLVHGIFHRSCWSTGDNCYLQDLFVSPDVRGAGIGRQLIEYVYNHAQAAGCAKVYWQTQEDNTQAQQLYERIASRTDFIQYRHLLG